MSFIRWFGTPVRILIYTTLSQTLIYIGVTWISFKKTDLESVYLRSNPSFCISNKLPCAATAASTGTKLHWALVLNPNYPLESHGEPLKFSVINHFQTLPTQKRRYCFPTDFMSPRIPQYQRQVKTLQEKKTISQYPLCILMQKSSTKAFCLPWQQAGYEWGRDYKRVRGECVMCGVCVRVREHMCEGQLDLTRVWGVADQALLDRKSLIPT